MAALHRKKPLPHAYSAVQISSWRRFMKILSVVRGSKEVGMALYLGQKVFRRMLIYCTVSFAF